MANLRFAICFEAKPRLHPARRVSLATTAHRAPTGARP
jgi:hypothetical protein